MLHRRSSQKYRAVLSRWAPGTARTVSRKRADVCGVLVPDAAFALGRLDRRPPLDDVVLQARRDGEAAAERDPGRPTVDWNMARILSLRNLGRSAVTVADALRSPALSAAVANGFARQNLSWGS